ncbi:MAG: LCP family protein [Evtepia sp.]
MQKKRKLKKGYRVLRAIYRLCVVVASIVVVLYIASRFAIKPPPIEDPVLANPTTTPTATASEETDDPDVRQGSHERRKQVYTFLLAASDDGNGNADTIMVLTYDIPSQKIGIISLPRDTLIQASTPKINATYSKGIEHLEDAVSDLVGFPIDYHISIDMKAFVEIVDAVGGVDFEIPINMNYDDPTQNLAIHFKKGMKHLNGKDALKVARFRKNNDGGGYLNSDIDRTHTQHQLMMAIASKITSWSGVTKLNQFLDIFSSYIETDLTSSNIAYFGSKALSLNPSEDVSANTLPGDGDVTYRGYRWCYQLHEEETLALLNQLVNPYTEDLSLDDTNIFQARTNKPANSNHDQSTKTSNSDRT